MKIEELVKIANQIDGLGGMTVNERLFASGLMETFDKAMKNDKELAKSILQALKVDNDSIIKIIEHD